MLDVRETLQAGWYDALVNPILGSQVAQLIYYVVRELRIPKLPFRAFIMLENKVVKDRSQR